jgi:Ca2+-binding EF-hand superfamily protein
VKQLLLVTALALIVGFAAVQVAPDDARTSNRNSDLPSPAEAQRCMSSFEALDKNSDGVLTGDEFDNLNTAVKGADRNKDGKISSVEHEAACATGVLTDGDMKS